MEKLKNLLLPEFSTVTNSADFYGMLFKRKMKPDEMHHEYYLMMKTIANNLTDYQALISYIIDTWICI